MKRFPLPIASATPPADAPTPSALGLPLLRLGFRPFYLGAAVFSALALPLWIFHWLGGMPLPLAVPPMLWHAHEMLYGFAVAVIIGFLLTAGQAWTGLPTARGTALAALAGLWLAARIAAVAGPYWLYAALDVALLPVVAAIFGAVLLRARNRKNLPLAGILLALAAANACFHLAVMGLADLSPLQPLHAALGLIVMIECVVAGRVIPSFTANATPGIRVTARPRLAWAALGMTALGLLLWVFAPAGAWSGTALIAAAVLQFTRQAGWHPGATRGRPILWILHASYAWIGIGLALLGLEQFGGVAASAGLHALAVGATGGLIIGMITRTARGHTGRPLQVSPAETVAYVLVLAAAVLRVGLPIVAPQWVAIGFTAAAIAWSAAFAIYTWIYTPWLMRARVDGKDG